MSRHSASEQVFLKKLNEITVKNIHNEQFGVHQLARELGVSRSTLHRKIKLLINKSVSQYIRETRLNRAHKLLNQKEGTVSEIAYNVGFGSVTYFNKCFHKFYGYTPGEVLKGMHPEKKRAIKRLGNTKTWIVISASVLILGFVLVMLYPKSSKDILTNTLAVFPVEIDYTNFDSTENYEWLTIHIIDKINDFRNLSVVHYTAVAEYSAKNKSLQKISKELKVRYLIFPRVVQSGASCKVYVEMWDKTTGKSTDKLYEKNLTNLSIEDKLELQNNIAFTIADWMNIAVSPEEKQQFKIRPTDNMEAYNYYLKAIEILSRPDLRKRDAFQAKNKLEKAVALDPNFSNAYACLAHVYMGSLYYGPDPVLSDLFLDTAKVWLDKALICNKNNLKALEWTEDYYIRKQEFENAEKIARLIPVEKKPIKNYHFYFQQLNNRFAEWKVSESLEAFYEYMENKPEEVEVKKYVYDKIRDLYMRYGFPEYARRYAKGAYVNPQSPVNCLYSYSCINIEFHQGNFEVALQIAEKNKNVDNTNQLIYIWLNAYCAMHKRDYAQASDYLDQMQSMKFGDALEIFSSHKGRLFPFPFGYSYLQNSQEDKGRYYLERLLKKYKTEISLNGVWSQLLYPYFESAMVHSALGNEQEALLHLQTLLKKNPPYYWFVYELKTNPMFDNIRHTDQFQSLLKDFERQYQEEHKRIAKIIKHYEREPV